MPSFLDLTGHRLGKLLVVHHAGTTVYGGLSMPMWRCRCDCGTEETVPRVRLTSGDVGVKVDRCQGCRARICVECLRSFIPTSSRVMTCSEECRTSRRSRRTIANTRARETADPSLKQQQNKAYRDRRSKNPAKSEAARAYSRRWASENRSRLKAEKTARLSTLPPEEVEVIRDAERVKAAKIQRRIRAEAKQNDPERYEAILERVRKSRAKAVLENLMSLGDELEQRLVHEKSCRTK